jgi:hypothetical protein
VDGEGDDEEDVRYRDHSRCQAVKVRHHPQTSSSIPEIIVPRWKLEMEQKLQTGSNPVPFEESLKGDDGLRTVKVIVNDTLELISAGVESIIEDEVTPRFRAAEFPKWNCLTRYRDQYSHTK